MNITDIAKAISSSPTPIVIGDAQVAVVDGCYVMSRGASRHSLLVAATPLKRLVAHLAGFMGVELVDDLDAPEAPAPKRRVRRRGPGGITFTPARGDEPGVITLPFGRGSASVEAVASGDLDLTPAQLAWFAVIEESVIGD